MSRGLTPRRFTSHEDLSAFNVALTADGVPVTLRHIYSPSQPDEQSPLTAEQRDVLLLAYHSGYFKMPRRTTLTTLADTVEISDTALSQRVWRAVEMLIEQTLIADERSGQ
jgi:predicted DNA binding protein